MRDSLRFFCRLLRKPLVVLQFSSRTIYDIDNIMVNEETYLHQIEVTKSMLDVFGIKALEAEEPVILLNDETIEAETIRGDTLQEVVRKLPHTEGYIIIYSGWNNIDALHTQKDYVKVTAIAEDGTKTIVDYTDIKGVRIKIKTYPTEGYRTQYVLRWFPSR